MQIYIGVNKNGTASIHVVEPYRNEQTGTWVSHRPYLNSFIYDNVDNMVKNSTMTWNSEPETLEINLI